MIILPIFIREFMPQYFQSILVMQFLLLAYSINGLAFLPGTHLIANDWQLKLIPSFLLALTSATILNFLSILLGYGIYGVAIATIFTFCIYTFGLFFVYLRLMKEPIFRGLFRIFGKVFIFSFFAIILLYERFPIYLLLVLYLVIYGAEISKLFKIYFPILKSYLGR